MLDRFSCSRGRLMLSVGIVAAAILTLLALLTFAWEFALETSPAWQVGVHHLMLALLLSLTFGMAAYRPFCFGHWFPGVMLALAVVVPVVVFTAFWVFDGPYLGFRDARILRAVVTAVSSFVFVWAAAVFPYSFFLLGKSLVKCWFQRSLRDGC